MPGGAEIFRDCANCAELVIAPAGQAQMTLAIGSALRTFAAPLPHAFAIGRHEVTRAQFRAFVASSGYVPAAGCHTPAPDWRLNPVLSWDAPGFAQAENDPVVCINLEDARAYLVWLSRITGQRYRLPTDPEWHYVALRQADNATLPEKLCAIGNGADETAREANPGWAVAPLPRRLCPHRTGRTLRRKRLGPGRSQRQCLGVGRHLPAWPQRYRVSAAALSAGRAAHSEGRLVLRSAGHAPVGCAHRQPA